MSPLGPDTRLTLLRLARQAVESAVTRQPLGPLPAAPGLAEPCGAFVTLRHRGRLRGCIGQVESTDPLASVVARCAIAAATEDPRFPPIAFEEMQLLEIELSVLSAPQPVRFEAIEIGVHGLIVARGGRRGLLLPQVAEEHEWPVERFLEETCLKAGLDAYDWKRPDARIEAFTAEVFSDRNEEKPQSSGAPGD